MIDRVANLTPREQIAHDLKMRSHREDLKLKLVFAAIAVIAFWMAAMIWIRPDWIAAAVLSVSYGVLLGGIYPTLRRANHLIGFEEGFVRGSVANRGADSHRLPEHEGEQS